MGRGILKVQKKGYMEWQSNVDFVADHPEKYIAQLQSYVNGTVTGQYGDAIYGDNERYKRNLYYGRVSKGAKILLRDRKVSRNQYGLNMVKVKVISNEWSHEIGKIGWVGLKATSFKDFYNAQERTIDIPK